MCLLLEVMIKKNCYTKYVLEGAWSPKEFGESSLGDDCKDGGLAEADDNTQAHCIGLHDCMSSGGCVFLASGVGDFSSLRFIILLYILSHT